MDGGGEICAEIGLLCAQHETCRVDADCDVSLFCAKKNLKDPIGLCERCTNETCGYKHRCGSCSIGTRCKIDNDCHSKLCFVSESAISSAKKMKKRRGQFETETVIWGSCVSCHNGVRDGLESDVDCGGPNCRERCDVGRYCKKHSDCHSKHCSEESGRCISETRLERCTNGFLDFGEVCVDGSGICREIGKLCDEGGFCEQDEDCASGLYCESRSCTSCMTSPHSEKCSRHEEIIVNISSCYNNIQDGDESDKDCGGSCSKCPLFSKCLSSDSCTTSHCDALTGRCTLGVFGLISLNSGEEEERNYTGIMMGLNPDRTFHVFVR